MSCYCGLIALSHTRWIRRATDRVDATKLFGLLPPPELGPRCRRIRSASGAADLSNPLARVDVGDELGLLAPSRRRVAGENGCPGGACAGASSIRGLGSRIAADTACSSPSGSRRRVVSVP